MSRKRAKMSVTRREAMKRGLLGTAGLAMLGQPGVFGAPAAPIKPKAKSVIQIWMWGGPPHLDTFDPKPAAGYDYCGPLDKPIATNADGVQIGQLMPLLAQQADKYSIIRSMTHGVNSHETASYRVQTGQDPGRLVFPSVGAVVSLFKGYDNGYKGLVPPYVVLTKPQGRFSESGLLGPRYKPFATGGDPNQTRFVVEGIISASINDDRQIARRGLLASLDSMGRVMAEEPRLQTFDQCESEAYEMMFGEARQVFDLSQEKTELRDRYGRNTFGQSCLMARRLVELGVPYITINYPGWDLHKQIFETVNRKIPEMDNGMATLLADLSDRGLLDSTIVWWGGEFGRTPKVSWESPWNGGRGHHGSCFSAVLAGGGFKGGQVVGSSDAKGVYVEERPVFPVDLIESMYQLLGIDANAALPNPRGMDLKVLALNEDTERGGILKEIM